MTKEEKLRFELGEAFNRLSKDEIIELKDYFLEIQEDSEKEFGYSGDSLYYQALRIFCEEVFLKYNEEDFITAIIECTEPSCYGWALYQLKDSDMVEYAKEKMIEKLKKKGYSDDIIDMMISNPKLPEY